MPEQVLDTQSPEKDTIDPVVEETDEVVEEAVNNPDIVVDAGKEPEVVEEASKKSVWYENLPPDYSNDPDVTKYNSLEEYVKGNREVRKLIGKDKVVVPSDKSSDEDKAEFYKKLGRPDKAEDYVVPEAPEGMPDEVKIRPENLGQIKSRLHEMGLNKKQFAEAISLVDELNLKSYNQDLEAAQKLKETTLTSLNAEWGAAAETKIDGAQKVINTFFANKTMHKAFPILANDKGFVQAMSEIAESMGEDRIAGTPRATMTPVEAKTKLDALMAGSLPESKAYYDDTNPEHQAVVDQALSWQHMAGA